MELSKAYDPISFEDKIHKKWENSGLFNPDVCIAKGVADSSAPTYSMVLPPPNVTGTLHAGHGSMLAIQDAIIRYHRMKGDRTLWLPGTDHAAIATQVKVEKVLIEKGMKDPKVELGREKFIEEVKNFAQASHDRIVHQCKKMGSSLDWSREAYTLDDTRNKAVVTVFKKMYDDGLIYRGYRIVNWCPRCHSTIADDEVDHVEQSAKFYTFKYSSDFPFAIATTRPETKLGDTAVAVNPEDPRYKQYIGQTLTVKSFAGGADLSVKVIADPAVDPAFGTGALGVTPAHSLVDYEMAQKNKLPVIKVIDEDGLMTAEAGSAYAGLPVKEAREKVVKQLVEAGLMEKEEDIPNSLSVCYRCNTAIEPLPSRQWFVSVTNEFTFRQSKERPLKGIKDGEKTTLKKLMRLVVENGQTEIIPERFGKVYFHWIDNLRDWCISRQIWFSHRIPVWYQGEEIKVQAESPGEGWIQDPDTLDTWFSSGLWTFSTMGWPEETPDFKTYRLTSLLETGYDILFFWVARMILMTTYTLGEVPFEKVYLHGLVRDEQGRKMSKSLGNVIDPLEVSDKYGTDALRLALVMGNTPGSDLRLSEEKIAGYRNFTNKLWNMARFVFMNIESPQVNVSEPTPVTLADKWILSRLQYTVRDVTSKLESYQLSVAGETLRDFTWNELADWYLEIAKAEGGKTEILNYVMNTVLKLWHPVMPFVTESIWGEVYGEDQVIMGVKWPSDTSTEYQAEVKDMSSIQEVVTAIRTLRAENKVDAGKKISVTIIAGEKTDLIESNKPAIMLLARLADCGVVPSGTRPESAVGFIAGTITGYADLSEVVDKDKEIERLTKEMVDIEKYVATQDAKLHNEEFLGRAPEMVVEKEKQKLTEATDKLNKIKEQLAVLNHK